MKIHLPHVRLAGVAALAFGCAVHTLAVAQEDRPTYRQSQVERAQQQWRIEKERRAEKARREQRDARLAEQQKAARQSYAERQRQAQLYQAQRDRRRARIDPTAPAGRDPDDPRFAPGGKP